MNSFRTTKTTFAEYVLFSAKVVIVQVYSWSHTCRISSIYLWRKNFKPSFKTEQLLVVKTDQKNRMRHNWKCLEANEENVIFTGASLIDINWNTTSFSKLLPDPIVFTSGLAYAKRMCCLLKSRLCLCYIVKGIHSVCGVRFMTCSMGLSVGHILVKGSALSSKSSQVKLESAASGDGKTNKQLLMGYRAAAKSV